MKPERRIDTKTRDRLDVICANVVAERRRVTVLLSLVVFLLLALGSASFYLRGRQEELTRQAKAQAELAAQLGATIQQSRFEAFYRDCIHDAERNFATRAQLNNGIAETIARAPVAERPRLRVRLQQSKHFTITLLDAFLPPRTDKQCSDYAHRQTKIPLPLPSG